ncbi:MAG: hypothetical protein G01um101431_720 [Parcubacteria group bacterium Gr01-1014_31]|nr:MAG: hypothetical protein G01um101431_720 [Parcubacteria group bacterium Gr01-1014_31]
MPASRDRISPSEFKSTIKRLSKETYKTSYVPKKVSDALKQGGMGRFSWQTATKRQFQRSIDQLKEENIIKSKRTTKQLYEKVMSDREVSENVGSDVPLSITKLPGTLSARKFVEYYGKATGHPEHVRSALRELGMPFGSATARPGAEPNLNRRQMGLVLTKLREAGKLTHAHVGEDIMQSHKRTQVYVQEGIAQELSDQEQKRYNAAAREDLPEGIRRSIGRPVSESALRTGHTQERSSSIGRADREQGVEELETHPTTASTLARRETPNDPKTSIARKGHHPSPETKPDLPDLSFDLE